jgi:hypothetical protein
MAASLQTRTATVSSESVSANIRVADTTTEAPSPDSVDFILTSPPYCTRIDYTAATRVELALLSPLLETGIGELSRRMIGSVRVPPHDIIVSPTWGETCSRFLEKVFAHTSKASSGYYYRTHLDYFDKMSRSIAMQTKALKRGHNAVFVVQDSYYKEIYNNLPVMISEICRNNGLALIRRKDFHVGRTMAASHPYARDYKKGTTAIEAVLCFQKN